MYNGSILYHYTDFQAIDGILRCAQLRVNNVLRMNDSAEMRHFMKRLCAAIVDRLNQEGDPERAEEIWQLPLSDQEAQALAESCRIIREYGVKAAALSTLANEKIHG